jgi:hypothetical protein
MTAGVESISTLTGIIPGASLAGGFSSLRNTLGPRCIIAAGSAPSTN